MGCPSRNFTTPLYCIFDNAMRHKKMTEVLEETRECEFKKCIKQVAAITNYKLVDYCRFLDITFQIWVPANSRNFNHYFLWRTLMWVAIPASSIEKKHRVSRCAGTQIWKTYQATYSNQPIYIWLIAATASCWPGFRFGACGSFLNRLCFVINNYN